MHVVKAVGLFILLQFGISLEPDDSHLHQS